MAVRLYSGSARPVDEVFEGRDGFEVVEADLPDGSIERGYRETATGRLRSMATMVLSPARSAALAAARAASDASDTQIANFRQSIRDLAVKVKNNTATAAEQRQLLVKLARVADNLLSDAP